MRKYFFLILALLVYLPDNAYSQSWDKLIVGQFNHNGNDDGWYWYEFTYSKDGAGKLVYFVDKTRDTLKYDIPADSESMIFCRTVLDSLLHIDQGGFHENLSTRKSAVIQYSDESGVIKKVRCRMLSVIPILNKLNVRYYIDLAAKKHKELVE